MEHWDASSGCISKALSMKDHWKQGYNINGKNCVQIFHAVEILNGNVSSLCMIVLELLIEPKAFQFLRLINVTLWPSAFFKI